MPWIVLFQTKYPSYNWKSQRNRIYVLNETISTIYTENYYVTSSNKLHLVINFWIHYSKLYLVSLLSSFPFCNFHFSSSNHFISYLWWTKIFYVLFLSQYFAPRNSGREKEKEHRTEIYNTTKTWLHLICYLWIWLSRSVALGRISITLRWSCVIISCNYSDGRLVDHAHNSHTQVDSHSININETQEANDS